MEKAHNLNVPNNNLELQQQMIEKHECDNDEMTEITKSKVKYFLKKSNYIFNIQVVFDWAFNLFLDKWIYVRRNERKHRHFNLSKVFVLSFTLYNFGKQKNKPSPREIFQCRRSDEILGVYINGDNLLVKIKIG